LQSFARSPRARARRRVCRRRSRRGQWARVGFGATGKQRAAGFGSTNPMRIEPGRTDPSARTAGTTSPGVSNFGRTNPSLCNGCVNLIIPVKIAVLRI